MTAFTVSRKRSPGYCAFGCKGNAGRREGVMFVHIAGHPVGHLCTYCLKEAQETWRLALTNWEEPQLTLVTVCECGCGEPAPEGQRFIVGHSSKTWTRHGLMKAA